MHCTIYSKVNALYCKVLHCNDILRVLGKTLLLKLPS